MNSNEYRVEFRDFTVIGGEGSYAVSLDASSAKAAESIVLSLYPAAWDISANLIAYLPEGSERLTCKIERR